MSDTNPQTASPNQTLLDAAKKLKEAGDAQQQMVDSLTAVADTLTEEVNALDNSTS